MRDSVELVADAKAALGEGAIWDSKRHVLYWVDIVKYEVHVYDPSAGQDRAIPVGQYVGTVVPRMSGGVMLALHHGFAHLDLESEELRMVGEPKGEPPTNRFNDGKCDPAGRFWAGTISLNDIPEVCSLYRLDRDLSIHRMLGRVSNSNGIVWSLDHASMYYIDTPTREVAVFDYDIKTGNIANRRTAIRIPEDMGWPDGMAIDSEGMVWIALWGGGRVTRWNPRNGTLLQTIPLPVSNVTSCAFGGPTLDDLYITSARFTLDEEKLHAQPLAGGLFRARPGISGVAAYAFAG